MERYVIIVNGWKLLTIIPKRSILDVAAALESKVNNEKYFQLLKTRLKLSIKTINWYT